MEEQKVAENRLRRAADRQGYRLEKSKRRDPRAIGYGTFSIIRISDGEKVAGDPDTGRGLNLAEVDQFLSGR
jgi:hypothetical protein